MIPQPSAVTPELAETALNRVPLVRARKLAEWIGSPSRQPCRSACCTRFRLEEVNARLRKLI